MSIAEGLELEGEGGMMIKDLYQPRANQERVLAQLGTSL